MNPYKPPPQLIYDEPISGSLYANETEEDLTNALGLRKFACEYFYDILEKEEFNFRLQKSQRQVRNLQDNVMECFAVATLEFLDQTQKGLRCYERRKRCIELRGWCQAGKEYGYCSEINEIPDTPDVTYPLFEVQTNILPKEVLVSYFQLISVFNLSH